jgi:HlyD family secretion protein
MQEIIASPLSSSSITPYAQFIEETTQPALRRMLRTGMITIAVFVVGLGGMAAFIPMTGAVIASGNVTVEGSVKRVGHPFGGVVSDIYVEDGDRVEKSQPLMRLDTTVSGALAQLTGQSVDQLLALEARLKAERDGTALNFPAELARRSGDPEVAAILRNEQRNFQVGREARGTQVAQMRQRSRQAAADIVAYRSQIGSYARQSELINQELAQARELFRSKLTTLDRLNALERSAAGLEANRQTALASIQQAQARIGESLAQASTVGSAGRSTAAEELVRVQSVLADLKKQKASADDTLDRTIIRAPESGIVDKIAVKTIGAVIPTGETLLEIVPDNEKLTVQARILPNDIDQIEEGQKAVLLFSGLNRQTTPEIEGTVSFVSADSVTDDAGRSFYRVTIDIPQKQLVRLGAVKLRVGMPVEAFIQTSDRTILSFILRPLADQLRRSFRSN